jgi:hypothetical protein
MSSGPAGTISVAVIVVSGSVTDFKVSQDLGCWPYSTAAHAAPPNIAKQSFMSLPPRQLSAFSFWIEIHC